MKYKTEDKFRFPIKKQVRKPKIMDRDEDSVSKKLVIVMTIILIATFLIGFLGSAYLFSNISDENLQTNILIWRITIGFTCTACISLSMALYQFTKATLKKIKYNSIGKWYIVI